MTTYLPITTEPDAVPALIAYLKEQGLKRLNLVADERTYAALGQRVSEALIANNFDLKRIILAGEEIAPNEESIVKVLVAAGNEERAYLSVGSGVITDITRFVSYRTRTRFIAMPTAPSVDGYTSVSSSLVLANLKTTVPSFPPEAIFSDLNTLCAAPGPMIAAGFADVMAKYTSVADWRTAHLVWTTPFDEAIARRAETARDECARRVDLVGQRSPEGIRSLIDALAETGLCMVDFGMSHPAGGSEHYVSHIWEMKLLKDGKPAILHGAKVGVGTILMAGLHEQIRAMSKAEAAERLAASPLPDRAVEEARIRAAYSILGLEEQIIKTQAPFLDMSEADYEALKQRILDSWEAIQAVSAVVPSPAQLTTWIGQMGGPVSAAELGFTPEEENLAYEYSHYFRDRFTVAKLSRILGLLP